MKVKKFLAVILVILTVVSLFNIPLLLVNAASSGNKTISVNDFSMGGVDETTGKVYTSTVWAHTDYIDMSGYEQFYVKTKTNSYNWYWYDENHNFLSAGTKNTTAASATYTSYDIKGKYMRFGAYVGSSGGAESVAYTLVLKHTVSNFNIDTSKTGSLTIYNYQIPKDATLTVQGTGENADYSEYFKQIGASPLQGVTFTIKRVVNETFKNNAGSSFYTESGVTLPDVNTVKSEIASTNGAYKVYNTYTLSPTDSTGKSIASNLPLGIYLVQETAAPSGSLAHTSDYLVSVPTTSASSRTSWNYNVVSYPKTRNGVTLTYNPNNPLSPDLPFSEGRWANRTEPLTENHFIATGMVFLGWADDPNDVKPDWVDKDDFTMPDHDMTIYALWGYTNSFRYYTAFKYSEPWGLKLSFAMLNPKSGKVIDYSQYTDYGMYVYPKHKIKKAFILNWETGGISTTGELQNQNGYRRSPDYIDVSDFRRIDCNFTPKNDNGTAFTYVISEYDSDKNFIGRVTFRNNNGTAVQSSAQNTTIEVENPQSELLSLSKDCKFIRFHMWTKYGNSYNWTDYDISRLKVSVKYKTPSMQEVLKNGKRADKYETSRLQFNDGSIDNYVTTVYDEKIFTQNLDEDIFVIPYVKYKGRTFWGTVKNRSVEDSIKSIIQTSQVGLTSYTEAEVKLATAIKSMYDAEMNYYIKGSASSTYPDGNKMVDNEINIEWENGGINGNGTPYENASCIRTKDFIDISKYSSLKTTFNNEKNSPYSYSVFTYDKDKKFISRQNFTRNSNTYTYAVGDETINTNSKYVKIHIYTNKSDYEWTADDYKRLSITGKKFGEGENKTFTHLTSLRAIEPWEMKLQAQPQNADYESYDDYGVITYTDYYNTFDKDKTLTYSDLINNDNAIVFSKKDGTCVLETYNGSQFITATSENIYTYRLQQTNVYTCFYYVKNGNFYYSDIKKRNGLDMANKVIENKITGDDLSEAAAAVAESMINLYRETYYYRNGKYPTDDYDGPVWYLDDKNLIAEPTT